LGVPKSYSRTTRALPHRLIGAVTWATLELTIIKIHFQ
jgi:hypothetical protein